jgi:hypothetical protein
MELTFAETSAPPITRYEDYVGPQNPEAHLPKCLSPQQLVISINPKFLKAITTGITLITLPPAKKVVF